MSNIAPTPLAYVRQDAVDYLKHSDFNRSPRNRMKLACVIDLLRECGGPPADIRVLEIGCGIGNIAIPVASLGHPMQAIDIDETSIAEAGRRNRFANLSFQRVLSNDLDVAGFDVIIMSDVLEHIATYRDTIRDLGARMKPGAHFILTIPNGWCLCELACRPSYLIKPYPLGQKIVAGVKRLLKTKDLTTANMVSPHVNFFTTGRTVCTFEDSGFAPRTFHRFFVAWTFWETFFSARRFPDSWPEKDFVASQRLPAWMCSEFGWRFQKR